MLPFKLASRSKCFCFSKNPQQQKKGKIVDPNKSGWEAEVGLAKAKFEKGAFSAGVDVARAGATAYFDKKKGFVAKADATLFKVIIICTQSRAHKKTQKRLV